MDAFVMQREGGAARHQILRRRERRNQIDAFSPSQQFTPSQNNDSTTPSKVQPMPVPLVLL